jgi:protein-disulfide isomerase
VDQILAAYPKDVRFIYKQFPLTQIHKNALPAAKASVAADEQGKFWEMHDELFKIARDLSAENIRKKAEEVGLNVKKWEAAMASPDTEKKIQEDMQAAQAADVTGTPTFFINGKRVTNRSFEGMKAMIEGELKQASR